MLIPRRMAGSGELEKFREEWKKELQKQGDPSHVSIAHADDSQEEKHKLDSYQDDNLPSASGLRPASNLQLVDDASQDGFEAEENIHKKSESNNHSDTSDYYPFKILTQFLNEAPKKLKGKNVKADIKDAGLSYMKRKYFSSEMSGTKEKKMKDENKESTRQEVKDKECESTQKMLDIFIADLDEINEIPFFDTTVPREVAMKIFQHLDLKTLCSCSQVSHSWRSLANDELLWFGMCQKLGFDADLHVSEDQDWKGKVRRNIEQGRLLKANWKARVGKPYHLTFARGGVLCAVHSHGSNIVAGYTSCNVRSWNTKTGDVCTYNASNTALILDESAEDLGRIHNEIKHLSTTELITTASFKHGFVDVWQNEESTEPILTFTFNNPDITSLSAQDIGHNYSLVAASQGTRIQIWRTEGENAERLDDFDMQASVTQLNCFSHSPAEESPQVLLTCHNSVHLKKVSIQSSWAAGPSDGKDHSLTEVHNIIWAPITCIGFRGSCEEVAVGFNLYTGPSTQVKVNIYDVGKNQLKATLTGHTWLISSIHMPHSLTDQLVTGSGDRKIRVYDLRVASFPSMTLVGHAAKVVAVEMDDWKVVSGDEGGFVCVWDQRMCRKLWDVHNRHPVQYCHFDDRLLFIGNVPYQKFPEQDEFETVSSLRYRGTVQVYDFLANQQTQGIPDICLSSYNEPEAYDYNLGLAVPYDVLS